MRKKAIEDFTPEEKNWMDTVAVNYIIAQSDGYQLGYAQAISDFSQNIIDYWEGSDDKPQQSVLDTLVDMGVELGKRQETVAKNIEVAKEHGYENDFFWKVKTNRMSVSLYTKDFDGDEAESKKENNQQEDGE